MSVPVTPKVDSIQLNATRETIEKLDKNIQHLSSQLNQLFSKVEKQLSVFLESSEAGKHLSEQFSEFGKDCAQYPLLSKCLTKAATVTSAMSRLIKALSMEWSETMIQPINQILKVELKEVKNQKKIYDKSFGSYEASKMKVKQCREKGAQTNMMKLMELENERESLKKKCEIKTLETMTKFEIFFEKMEVETSSGIYNFMFNYQRFHKNASQLFANIDSNLTEFKQTIEERKVSLSEKLERGNKELEDLGGEIVPFLIQNPELRDANVNPAPIGFLPQDDRHYFTNANKFAVTKIGKTKQDETLQININESPVLISVYHLKNQNSSSRPINQLLQVYKSNTNPKKLNLQWVNKDKPISYLFIDSEQRERFYEIVTFAANSARHSPPKVEEEINIFVGSWNMGDAPPPADVEELGKWIPKKGYFIYAIGVQECEYKVKGDEVENTSGQSCEADWFARIQEYLGSDFIKVFGLSLMSMRLIVFVHRDHFFKISHVKKASEATGIANIVGNKGAVGVSFQYNESRICFVNSHLAAHLHKVEDRNQNFRQIVQNLKLHSETSCSLVNYFHYLFWFGDLNYRLQADRDEVLNKIKEKKFEDLRLSDQLNRERVWGNTFAGFTEGLLNFPPTYRYLRGVREYNDEKLRIPSWCDRVLWKTLPGCEVKQLTYQSCDEIMTSDHSPIQSTFVIKTKMANWPFVPKSATTCRILITEVEAGGLATTSNGDISLTFIASFLKEFSVSSPLTPLKANKYQPAVPPIEIISSNKEFIQNEHLFLIFKEHGKKKEVIDVGQCAIGMAGACGVEPTYFDCKVLNRGKIIGRVTGKIHFSWDKEKTSEVSYSRDAFIQKKGYLMKQGRHRKNWARRWCVLLNKSLFYYPTETATKPIGSFPVRNTIISTASELDRQNVFVIETVKRTYFLCASSSEEMVDWMKELKLAAGMHMLAAHSTSDSCLPNTLPDRPPDTFGHSTSPSFSPSSSSPLNSSSEGNNNNNHNNANLKSPSAPGWVNTKRRTEKDSTNNESNNNTNNNNNNSITSNTNNNNNNNNENSRFLTSSGGWNNIRNSRGGDRAVLMGNRLSTRNNDLNADQQDDNQDDNQPSADDLTAYNDRFTQIDYEKFGIELTSESSEDDEDEDDDEISSEEN